ncbi:MAG: MscL family protein [Gemmatimonadaceae bacterium]|nr:MscL family protein [Gemmatimonadaceae bacterium]
MLREFKAFLIKQNVVALALAVVIGAALTKLVTAVVDDFIMPFAAALTPSNSWKTATFDIGPVKLGVGDFFAALINFLIIGFVAWRMTKLLVRDTPPDSLTTKCPFCVMDVDKHASRCPYCTSALTAT